MTPVTGNTVDTPGPGQREGKLPVQQDAMGNDGECTRPARGKPVELDRKEVEKNIPADPDPDDPASP